MVEDNPEVQKVAGMLLKQLGYRVFHAESATVALQFLASGEAVDLVFTDVVMPGELDGVALARRVKEEYPNTAVLLTSGYAKAAAPLCGRLSALAQALSATDAGSRHP